MIRFLKHNVRNFVRAGSTLLMFGWISFACSSASDPVKTREAVAAFKPDMHPDSTVALLKKINALEDDTLREQLFNTVWNTLVAADQIPQKKGDRVLFLYRGMAHNVRWNGAFNKWGKDKNILGLRLHKLNLWYALATFDEDARLEYKIVLNTTNWFTQFFGWETQWIPDPANPHQRPGSSGLDSELIMPGYKLHPETIAQQDVAKGTLSEPEIIVSLKLGYSVSFQVYTPAGYEKMKQLPVVYVTDGHEYASDDMGKMITVLDNTIADGTIKPVIAVFIDPRDIETKENRRMTEFSLNEAFAGFIAEELVPLIDARFRTAPSPKFRAIMGTSLGGLNAAWIGYKFPHVFGNLAIHSPAFWFRDAILDYYKQSERLPLTIYMATGTVNDAQEHTRLMREILLQKGYTLEYQEYHESHSWGLWSGLIDDPLRFFWGRNEVQKTTL